jgi:hypothetical protein
MQNEGFLGEISHAESSINTYFEVLAAWRPAFFYFIFFNPLLLASYFFFKIYLFVLLFILLYLFSFAFSVSFVYSLIFFSFFLFFFLVLLTACDPPQNNKIEKIRFKFLFLWQFFLLLAANSCMTYLFWSWTLVHDPVRVKTRNEK